MAEDKWPHEGIKKEDLSDYELGLIEREGYHGGKHPKAVGTGPYSLYYDSEGYLTGGFGHRLTDAELKKFNDPKTKQEVIDSWDKLKAGGALKTLRKDIDIHDKIADDYLDYYDIDRDKISDPQYQGLRELAFSMGGVRAEASKDGLPHGLHSFKQMGKALAEGDSDLAAKNLLLGKHGPKKNQSKWSTQVGPDRSAFVAGLLKQGKEDGDEDIVSDKRESQDTPAGEFRKKYLSTDHWKNVPKDGYLAEDGQDPLADRIRRATPRANASKSGLFPGLDVSVDAVGTGRKVGQELGKAAGQLASKSVETANKGNFNDPQFGSSMQRAELKGQQAIHNIDAAEQQRVDDMVSAQQDMTRKRKQQEAVDKLKTEQPSEKSQPSTDDVPPAPEPPKKSLEEIAIDKQTEKLASSQERLDKAINTFEKRIGELDQNDRKWFRSQYDELKQIYNDNKKRLEWAEVGEMVARALATMAAGWYAVKNGKTLDGLKFDKTDWSTRHAQNMQELRTELSALSEEQSLATAERKEKIAGMARTIDDLDAVVRRDEQNLDQAIRKKLYVEKQLGTQREKLIKQIKEEKIQPAVKKARDQQKVYEEHSIKAASALADDDTKTAIEELMAGGVPSLQASQIIESVQKQTSRFFGADDDVGVRKNAIDLHVRHLAEADVKNESLYTLLGRMKWKDSWVSPEMYERDIMETYFGNRPTRPNTK